MSADTLPLSARLRAATGELHRQVERAGILPALLRGRLERVTYCALLRNLHALYAALESALQAHAAHRALCALPLDRLWRRDALAQDLHLLAGPAWPALPLQPALRDHVARIESLAASQPALLAAHAYVRYLGDLSGGQALSAIVARSFGLSGDDGVRFYAFGPADATARLAADVRHALDAIPASVVAPAELVDEACAAFVRHRALFEQLARPMPADAPADQGRAA